MKYAIYDKAVDGYLTSMEFDTDLPDNYALYACGYNEYITEARLLDTPKETADAIVRIESCKFMDKGRFVVHSFDDTLKDQYIISEAGTPTKVVDNITVDLNGAISVKYGTMAFHWSATSLVYAVNRMFKLQNSLNPNVYTSWCDTFDIYKVITVIDEKSCTHYQFIKVTEKGLEDYKKNEEIKLLVAGKDITDVTYLLNKRIEEPEKANYDLGEQVTARGAVANRLQEENDKLKNKVEEEAKAKDIAEKIIDICDSNDDFTAQLYKFSKLYATIDNISKTTNSSFMMAFNKFLALMSTANKSLDKIFGDNIDMMIKWRSESEKLRKDLENQKKLNDANEAIIARMVVEKRTMSNELSDAVDALESTRKVLTTVTNERDKALERAKKFKGIANSVYGMTIPARCCGKQLMADILSGKKIPIDKEKYDNLLECINNISLTYEMMKIIPFSMDRPSWLSGIINRINDLTK